MTERERSLEKIKRIEERSRVKWSGAKKDEGTRWYERKGWEGLRGATRRWHFAS